MIIDTEALRKHANDTMDSVQLSEYRAALCKVEKLARRNPTPTIITDLCNEVRELRRQLAEAESGCWREEATRLAKENRQLRDMAKPRCTCSDGGEVIRPDGYESAAYCHTCGKANS